MMKIYFYIYFYIYFVPKIRGLYLSNWSPFAVYLLITCIVMSLRAHSVSDLRLAYQYDLGKPHPIKCMGAR